MKRSVLSMLACIAACACNSTRILYDDSADKTYDYGDMTLWSSAISFPRGYDWMKDSLGGNVPCNILLFHGKDEILRLNAGEDGPFKAESDMHGIIDGHLFSQCSSEEGITELFRDGTSVLSFEGRESIDWIHLRGSDIYTLGCCRDTDGWSFRKNGTLVFGQNRGRLLSPLYEDDGKLCFAWSCPLTSSSGKTATRYYIMVEGEQIQVSHSSDVKNILCIRRFHGNINFLASSSILDEILWEDGTNCSILDGSSSSGLADTDFFVAGDKLYAHLKMKKEFYAMGKMWRDYFYENGREVFCSDPGMLLCSTIRDMPGFAMACSAGGGVGKLSVTLSDGPAENLPDGYIMVSPNAFCFDGRRYCMGLNDGSAQKRPLIINRGDTIRFDFNGYFTCLSLP